MTIKIRYNDKFIKLAGFLLQRFSQFHRIPQLH